MPRSQMPGTTLFLAPHCLNATLAPWRACVTPAVRVDAAAAPPVVCQLPRGAGTTAGGGADRDSRRRNKNLNGRGIGVRVGGLRLWVEAGPAVCGLSGLGPCFSLEPWFKSWYRGAEDGSG